MGIYSGMLSSSICKGAIAVSPMWAYGFGTDGVNIMNSKHSNGDRSSRRMFTAGYVVWNNLR